jgi:hypothetical protein
MRKAVSNFKLFAAKNRRWLICLVICFAIDRCTTYIVLNNKWFGEANPVALKLWASIGYASTEILTVLLIALVFFYIGAWGKQYLKDYVLPAFCIIYGILMLYNVAAFMIGALGLLQYGRYIDFSSVIDYNLFVFILILMALAVLFIMKSRTPGRMQSKRAQTSTKPDLFISEPN